MQIFFKLVIAIAAFGLSTYFGFRASKKYAARELYFAELVQFCDGLKGEIGFARAPLAEIFAKYQTSYKSFLTLQLKAAGEIVGADNMTGEITDTSGMTAISAGTDNVIDEETLRAKLPRGSLTADEFDNVVRFFNTLGKSDTDNQIDAAAGYKTAFSVYLENARADKKKYSPLYWKLGLLGAAAFALLLI